MSYYDNSRPWPAVGQNAWNDLDIDSQTVRSSSSSTVPTQAAPPPQGPEGPAFSHQLEEVDRAIDNLVKSGKMFGAPGRREWHPPSGPGRKHSGFDGRQPHGLGARPHSMAEFGDARGAHQSNLQNFYASQRHQSSRGSSEAEQMIQAKRRMAAQRERELRNYHQEQQYNRTVLAELSSYGGKPDRTLSPSGMSEADRRDLIARQRSALYGEGSFAETGGYVDETGASRPGAPAPHTAPGIRGHSPLTYEYGRAPPAGGPTDATRVESSSPAGDPTQQAQTSNSASPQPNLAGSDPQTAQPPTQLSRTSTSSPGASPINGKPGSGSANTVAPIGTRPSVTSTTTPTPAGSGAPTNPALGKRSTTPLASPMAYATSGASSENVTPSSGSNSANTSTADGAMGVSGWGSRGGSVWGNSGKPGSIGVQASVWG